MTSTLSVTELTPAERLRFKQLLESVFLSIGDQSSLNAEDTLKKLASLYQQLSEEVRPPGLTPDRLDFSKLAKVAIEAAHRDIAARFPDISSESPLLLPLIYTLKKPMKSSIRDWVLRNASFVGRRVRVDSFYYVKPSGELIPSGKVTEPEFTGQAIIDVTGTWKGRGELISYVGVAVSKSLRSFLDKHAAPDNYRVFIDYPSIR